MPSSVGALPASASPPGRRRGRALPALLLAVAVLAACQPATAHAYRPREAPDAAAGAATAPVERVVRATPVTISDGDSFVVRSADGARLRVRLAGIDAPESSQPYSKVARQHLRKMLDGNELVLHAVKIDPFDRLVARVSVDGLDPALALIEAGLAWHFARYDHDLPPTLRKRYAAAQRLARCERRGLWRAADPEPPWEFRRRSRGNGNLASPTRSPAESPATLESTCR